MKKHILLSFTVFSCLFSLHAYPAPQRGDLASPPESLGTIPQATIQLILTVALGNEIDPALLALAAPINYDVDAYRLIYWTEAPDGQLVKASGLALLPVNYGCDAALAAYFHGTLTLDLDAPSTSMFSSQSMVGMIYAAGGYVAALPDYLGLGLVDPAVTATQSPLPSGLYPGVPPYGVSPFLHAESEASASIDMMRATRKLCAMQSVGLNGQVFLSGYSQGAHTVVATMREIEKNYPNEFNLIFTAAGSGPYDLSNTQYEFIINDPFFSRAFFIPYVFLSYQGVYGNLYKKLSQPFVFPYHSETDPLGVPTLFNGSFSQDDIDSSLPASWEDALQPKYLDKLKANPFHPVRKALRKNNLLNFKPESPLRLYYCTGDEVASFHNSLVAWVYYTLIKGAGKNVKAIPLGSFNHLDCAPYALIFGKINFDRLRTTTGCSFKTTQEEMEDFGKWEDLVYEQNLPGLEELLKEAGLSHLLTQRAMQADLREVGLKLYPNPASTMTTLDLSSIETPVSMVRLIDLHGRVIRIYGNPAGQTELQISCSNLSSGMYIMEIFAGRPYYLNLMVD